MPSFVGHALPGTFFILYALWSLVDTLNAYFRKSGPFTSRLIYYVTCCQGRRQVAVLAWMILIATFIGTLVELPFASILTHDWPEPANKQHATMYFFFGLVGLQNVVMDRVAPTLYRRDLEYATMTLAMVVEGLLFRFHLTGRQEKDVVIHTLLVYTLFVTAAVLLVECRYEHSLVLALTRSYVIMLQGTWFIQIAFTLYNPSTNPWGKLVDDAQKDTHHAGMLVASMFSWHMGAIFVIYVTTVLVTYRYCGDSKPRENEWRARYSDDTHVLLTQEEPDQIVDAI